MNLALADGVAATQLGEDIVFLDLSADQYSCFHGQSDINLQGRTVNVISLDGIRPLIEAGFLNARPPAGECEARLPPKRPIADLNAPATAPVRVKELFSFLACWLETLVRFPGRSILTLHSQVRNDGTSEFQPDLGRVGRRVAVFETLLPWIPFPGACLFRCYLLLRFLQRGGGDARWIIGVRTWPFEAHCWLQIGDTVLDDRCERLVRFQPLLAI